MGMSEGNCHLKVIKDNQILTIFGSYCAMADSSQKSFKNRARLNGKLDEELAQAEDFVAQRLSAITKAKPVTCPEATATLRQNKPRAPRTTVYRLATLFVNSMDSERCIVVNLSADGARITMEDVIDLPETVVLRFDQSGIRKNARVVWRQDRDAGLCFIKNEETEENEIEE